MGKPRYLGLVGLLPRPLIGLLGLLAVLTTVVTVLKVTYVILGSLISQSELKKPLRRELKHQQPRPVVLDLVLLGQL